jgi:hypothetical protein
VKSHRAFFSFICIIGLIAVWYWGVAFQALYHYVSLDVYVKPDVIEWHVQEKEKGKYFVEGIYSFDVQGELYSRKEVVSSDLMNIWIAEDIKKQMGSKKPKVWYKSQNPRESTLLHIFPWKKCLTAITLTGIWGYFLWLGYYIRRRYLNN